MPRDMSVLATIISMTINGIYIINPIWNPVLSSLMINAGIKVNVDTSSGDSGLGASYKFTKSARSASRVCLNMNSRIGSRTFVKASSWVIVPAR